MTAVAGGVVERYLEALTGHDWDRVRRVPRRRRSPGSGRTATRTRRRPSTSRSSRRLMPTLPGYSMEVTRITYGDRRRVRRAGRDGERSTGVPLRTPECITFDLADDGRIAAHRGLHPDLRPGRLPDPMRLGHRHAGGDAAAGRARGVGGRRRASTRSRASSCEAERLGYDFCTCSEHVAVPVDVGRRRAARTYWDPLPTFGYLAARTDDDPLRHVRARPRLPPPARDREAVRHARPRERRPARPRRRRRLARGGVRAARRRVRRPRPDRRRRDPRAARRALGTPEPEYDGEYFAFGGFVVDPTRGAGPGPDLDRRPHRALAAPRGRARRRLGAVRPAARPSSARLLDRARDDRGLGRRGPSRSRSSCRTTGPSTRRPSPTASPSSWPKYAAIGATTLAVRFVHHSLAHYREQLAALATLEAAHPAP